MFVSGLLDSSKVDITAGTYHGNIMAVVQLQVRDVNSLLGVDPLIP